MNEECEMNRRVIPWKSTEGLSIACCPVSDRSQECPVQTGITLNVLEVVRVRLNCGVEVSYFRPISFLH
jgi:hypothetical protein